MMPVSNRRCRSQALRFTQLLVGASCLIGIVTAPVPAAEPRPNDKPAASDRQLILMLLVTETRVVNGREQRISHGQMVEGNFQDHAFNTWIFSEKTKFMTRDRLEQQLERVVEDLGRQTQLSDELRGRLLEAGRVDIARFWVEYEELVAALKSQPKTGTPLKEIIPLGTALQSRYAAGLHGEHSLFGKVLRTATTPEQQAAFPQEVWSKPPENPNTSRMLICEQDADGRINVVP